MAEVRYTGASGAVVLPFASEGDALGWLHRMAAQGFAFHAEVNGKQYRDRFDAPGYNRLVRVPVAGREGGAL